MGKDDLKRLFYRNETSFSFEEYVSKMKQTFDVLENCNVTEDINIRNAKR